jgi:hypothetical protein
MGYILSHFSSSTSQAHGTYDNDTRSETGAQSSFRDGDGKDQVIADSPNDKSLEYVWWGDKYHITFDSKGEIIPEKSGDDLLNPIGRLPIVSLAKDRDGSFWALGGEDLVEGSILINTILTDIYYIAKMHGTGLFYLFGKGVPKNIKVGPNQGISLEVGEDDPTPTIGFANANPQLSDHKDLIEQYLAILLSTNDIEPGSVSGELNAASAASGIQEIIMKSEPVGSVENDQEIFKNAEPEIVKIARDWHNLYLQKGLLVERLAKLGKIDSAEYSIKFGAIQQFINEKEKLEVIEKRLGLKLDDMIDALILDNPDLSRDEAKKLLEERERERVKSAATDLANQISEDGKDGGQGNEDIEPGDAPQEDQQVG